MCACSRSTYCSLVCTRAAPIASHKVVYPPQQLPNSASPAKRIKTEHSSSPEQKPVVATPLSPIAPAAAPSIKLEVIACSLQLAYLTCGLHRQVTAVLLLLLHACQTCLGHAGLMPLIPDSCHCCLGARTISWAEAVLRLLQSTPAAAPSLGTGSLYPSPPRHHHMPTAELQQHAHGSRPPTGPHHMQMGEQPFAITSE